MIRRTRERATLAGLLTRYPVVGLVGARQVGKSTLAGSLRKGMRTSAAYFDLENPGHAARLADPMLALKKLKGLVVIDEVQRMPELFQVLRVLADRRPLPARFLVLGSASPDLLRQGSETLAGRIFYHELQGFGLDEVGIDRAEKLWLRGGFPRAFLARNDGASGEWRREFTATFLERDLPQLGISFASATLRRFSMACPLPRTRSGTPRNLRGHSASPIRRSVRISTP